MTTINTLADAKPIMDWTAPIECASDMETLPMAGTTAIKQGPIKVLPCEVLFRRILLPIDGSALSLRAFHMGLDLAKCIGASVVVMHVVPPFNAMAYMTEFLAAAELRFSQHAVLSASRYLDKAKESAAKAQVPCKCHYVFGEHPNDAILEAVEEHQCDLIVMATHGWHGMNRLILGSETQKVVIRSRVPVLVCR